MDLHKFCVKFFVEDPGAVVLSSFIPVFHRWIQEQALGGLLIDVADYAHVAQGPGVVLVAHEANYSMDAMEGPLGLSYQRKTGSPEPLADRLAAGFRAALTACVRLEGEPEFQGKIRFRAGNPLFIANDRLHAPNTEAGFQDLRPPLAAALARVYPAPVELRRSSPDSRSRLAVSVGAAPIPAQALLARLA